MNQSIIYKYIKKQESEERLEMRKDVRIVQGRLRKDECHMRISETIKQIERQLYLFTIL